MEKHEQIARKGLVQKQKEFLMYGVPTSLMAITEIGLSFVTLAFAGHLGETVLAGIGLGNTIVNLLLWSILWGFQTVMNTYGPQLYASRNKANLGPVTLKILLQGVLIFIFILGIELNSSHIVSILPQDLNTGSSDHNGLNRGSVINSHSDSQNFKAVTIRYIRFISVVPLFDFIIAILCRYLVIQQHICRVYMISASMLIIHVIMNIVPVVWCDSASFGLAISTVLTRVLTLLLILVICWREREHLAWSGYSSAVCNNWGKTLKLGLSGSANMFAAFCTFESGVFLSKFNGITEMAVCVIFVQLIGILYTFASGIATASSILIGKALQEKDKSEVQSYMRMAVINSIMVSVGIAVVFYSTRGQVVHIFTSDPLVIDHFTNSGWVLIFQIPMDHVLTILSRGILIAFGKQRFVALTQGFISIFVTIPLMSVFIFCTNLGTTGVLFALIAYPLLGLVVMSIRIAKIDIYQEIQLSEHRTSTESEELCNEFEDGVEEESSPLTVRQKRKVTNREKKVLGWFLMGFVWLVSLVYISYL